MNRWRVPWVLALAFLVWAPAVAETEKELLAERREARLVRLSDLIAGSAGGDEANTGGAVPVLLDLAVSTEATPEQRRRAAELLARIAARADRSSAVRAENALETLRLAAERGSREVGPRPVEEERSRESLRPRLDSLMERIGDPSRSDRGRQSATLNLLASGAPAGAFGVAAFGYWMKSDPDAEVARWGEKLVARFEGRPPDPALVPPIEETEARRRRDLKRREAILAQSRSGDPRERHDALDDLAELLSRDDEGPPDPELVAALRTATSDPDPRVSARARFVSRGAAGDRPAFGMVYTAGGG